MVKILFIVLFAEVLTAGGQIFLKLAANDLESHDLKRIGAHFHFLSDVFSKPALWVGFVFMALGLVAWLFALAQGELSLVFSLGSSQYVIVLFLAHFILGEKIDRMKLLGTFLVVLGITFIAISR